MLTGIRDEGSMFNNHANRLMAGEVEHEMNWT